MHRAPADGGRLFAAMVRGVLVSTLCALLAVAGCVAHAEETRVHSWTRRGVAAPDAPVHVYVASSLNHTRIHQELAQLSDACHVRYGQYLDHDAAHDLLRVDADRAQRVQAWLEAQGSVAKPVHGVTMLAMNVSHATTLFQTTYHEYRHADGTTAVYAAEHTVPAPLQGYAEVFGPGLGHARAPPAPAPVLARRDDHPVGALDCDAPVYPSCIRRMYGTDTYNVADADAGRVGIAGFLNKAPSLSDLRAYVEMYRPDALQVNFTIANVSNTPASPPHRTSEANVDMQTVVAGSWPVPVTYYYGGGDARAGASGTWHGPNEPFLGLFSYLADLPDAQLPSVLSISYAAPEHTVPKAYAQRVCHYAAVLGARGVTILAGSGDTGVGAGDDTCETDGAVQFVPWFPASCPYITAVGGTATPPNESVAMESNAGYTTGSGFSNYFARPAWQDAVVGAYVNASVPHAYRAYFHEQGRAYPDVAAQSAHVAAQYRRAPAQVSGTSVSTPVMASVVALLNDALIREGHPPLGFMNPLLYTQLGPAGAFTDILHGNNAGCGTRGFSAAHGWDSPTGFGTPRFQPLLDALLDGGARAARCSA